MIRVHRDGQVIDVLKTASFEILRREDRLEAASLDGILTATLRVDDLRVGDELEVAMTVRVLDPTLGAKAAGVISLPHDPQPGRYRLGLSWEKRQEPIFKLTPDIEPVARRSANAVLLQIDNPELLAPPKDAPPRYGWQRALQYSDFSDWAGISRHFAPLYRKASTLGRESPLVAEAARIAGKHADALARARAALQLVQQEVRYIYVGLQGGNLTPATAEETWKRRYGDCKGKSALLLALLTELGIEAEAVLVDNSGSDDGLDQRLPNPGMFNHVIVRARIGGTSYWLDGTLPPVAEPSEQPVMLYRWVLPLTEPGQGIERLPWQPLARPEEVTLYEIDARAGFDRPARIVQTLIVRGIAGLQQYVQLSGLTPAQLLAATRQHMSSGTWESIDSADWHYDIKAQASILRISGVGPIDWNDDGDGDKSLSLPGGGFSPPERRARPEGQDPTLPYYNAPAFNCYVTTVRLPTATRPDQWSFNSTFDTLIFGRRFYRAFDLRDGAIRMVRGSRTEQFEIDPVIVGRDNSRIPQFDNSMAWIYYKSGESKEASSASGKVPATYEIDWAAQNVPCLKLEQ